MGLSKARGQFTSFKGEVEGDPDNIKLEIDLQVAQNMAAVDLGVEEEARLAG